MSILTCIQNILQLFIPPIVIKGARAVKNLFKNPDLYSLGFHYLEYAPNGWQTQLPNGQNIGWSVDSVVDTEKSKWNIFCRNLEGPGPLGFSHEHHDLSVIRNPNFHNVHISYAYVLALAAHRKNSISVLDWGGALGHYYLVGKAVLPDVSIDFHVKEVPLIAKAGKQVNPEVHWYDDESCLERDYDLIMMTGSIPYMKDWADVLHRIAPSVKDYLFIARLPVVEHSPSFVAIQRLYNSQMLHQQINQAEFLETVKDTGLTLVREFVVGDRPYIRGAPEQCEVRGWLFKRDMISGEYNKNENS
jgi:putative methyltransferase (TIGR04325 family)